jgi:lysine 2,3-aminomutase
MSGGTLRTVQQLVDRGWVRDADLEALRAVESEFAIAIPPHVAAQLDAGADGLRAQFVPTRAELRFTESERSDPIGDHVHSPIEGIVHRYPDRVLLKPVHVCPVYCRFCFRREQVGPDSLQLREDQLAAAIEWIAEQDAVREVILTGGDPGILAPSRLRSLIGRLAALDHIDVVRLHTRIPVVAPERVTPDFVSALRHPQVATWVAVHVNHPDELVPAADRAIAALADGGIPLVSQTVLLRGVNDDPDTLSQLFRGLVRRRVKPYYLHHGDLARGTAHFRTSLAEGRALMDRLRGRLSGLCLPAYVLDIPGGFGKVPATAEWVRPMADGRWQVRDWNGQQHTYSAD